MIETSYLEIIIGMFVQFVLGMLWYGPLFGKKWMATIGVTYSTKEEIKAMQKKAFPFYLMTIAASLFTNYVLYHLIKGSAGVHGVALALCVWLGFVMPVQLSGVIFDNIPREKMKAKFVLQAGYQLVVFITLGCLYMLW